MPHLPPTLTLATLTDLLASPEPVRLASEATWPLGPPAGTEPAPGPELLLACATGLGPELPPALVRRLLLLKAYELSQAPAGATPAAVRRLLDFFSRDVWPVVYAHGAVDGRAALAHLCLPLLGRSEVNYQGYRLAAADVLGLFGWEPLVLQAPAEAPALLGGQSFTLAYATEALARAETLEHAAAVLATAAAPAQPVAASAGLAASRPVIEAALSARPVPLAAPGAGAAPAPLLHPALAQLAEATAQLAAASAQRTTQLVTGLPAPATGYGLLALPQAAASLAGLAAAHRAAPGAAAANAAAEALRVAETAEQLLGLELLAAAQAFGLHQPGGGSGGPAAALGAAVAAFRQHVTFVAPDRMLAPDLTRAARFVREYAWPQAAR